MSGGFAASAEAVIIPRSHCLAEHAAADREKTCIGGQCTICDGCRCNPGWAGNVPPETTALRMPRNSG
jgi:hypothetical protein